MAGDYKGGPCVPGLHEQVVSLQKCASFPFLLLLALVIVLVHSRGILEWLGPYVAVGQWSRAFDPFSTSSSPRGE